MSTRAKRPQPSTEEIAEAAPNGCPACASYEAAIRAALRIIARSAGGMVAAVRSVLEAALG